MLPGQIAGWAAAVALIALSGSSRAADPQTYTVGTFEARKLIVGEFDEWRVAQQLTHGEKAKGECGRRR